MALREYARKVRLRGPDGSSVPLVAGERMLFESTAPEPPQAPPQWLPWYLLLGVALGGLATALGGAARRGVPRAGVALGTLAAVWATVGGLGGLVLAGLWAFTDHTMAYRNENLFQLNPLLLGLAALVPLLRAERREHAVDEPRVNAGRTRRPGLLTSVDGAYRRERRETGSDSSATAVDAPRTIDRLAAVVPVYRSDRVADVARETLDHVDQLVLVDDGAPPAIAAILDELADDPRVRVVSLGGNHGKGTAVAAGTKVALQSDPDAVIVLDSDGQHPPELIPAFAAAAEDADVVIGDRPRAAGMPRLRRAANAVSTWALSAVVRRRLRDTQNGMRLFRAEALRAVEPPPGRYEAETRHLKALIRGGHGVSWVPMPAIYGGEPSSFRTVRDSLRVLRAIVARPLTDDPAPTSLASALREWAPRIGLGMLLAWAVAAAMPLLGPLDEELFLAINALGDGPEWLYQALDPHSRNYLLLAAAATLAVLAATRRLRYAGGALLAMAFAGVVSDLVLEVIQLGYNRPRPEEALGAQVDLSHGRHWAHIPSFPSGHLIVTTALVSAAIAMAPSLRAPALGYLVAVAFTRMMFGAHFPLDVLLGAIIGWQVGYFSVAVVRAARMLPAMARRAPAPAALQPAAGVAAPAVVRA
jgi:membrane-associated phospholipid phosphatase